MNDHVVAVDSRHSGSLATDIAVLLVVGIALGVAHNALMLAAGPGRGLPWIKSARRVVKFEDLSPGSAPAAPVAMATAADQPPASGSHPGPGSGTSASAPRGPGGGSSAARPDSAAAKRAPADPPPAAARGANGATPGAPAATPAAPAASAVEAPVIPESREPIEAGIDVVRRLHEAKAALFVDARSPEEFAEGHIAGAVNLPFDDVFRDPDLAGKLEDHGRPIVTYCGGGDCELSRNLAFSILEAGRRRVVVFTGGLPDWEKAALPVVTGPKP